MYALVHGDRVQAEHYLSQTELLQIQNSPPQLFEGMQAMHATFGFAALGELLRVKQCLADVEAMAQQYAGWQPVAHCCRGAYQMLRGDFAQARVEFETGLGLMPVGHPAWSFCAGSLVSSLVHLTQYQEAVVRGRELLEQFRSAGIEALSIHHFLIALAAAESSVGRDADGLAHVQAAISALSAEGGGGVWLGRAHEARARIAMKLRETNAFEHSAAECYRLYRVGGHPYLLARYEKLVHGGRPESEKSAVHPTHEQLVDEPDTTTAKL